MVTPIQSFRILNPNRYRSIKLSWYYAHRQQINLSLMYPKSEKEEKVYLSQDNCNAKLDVPVPLSEYLRLIVDWSKKRFGR